ncbi:AMMECR1 domain-containing protein [Candidatus Gracilibacteria bacterium]|nr:AMMECR1 domain-containing protein [Candidatus Gracilibacteria bacterium]
MIDIVQKTIEHYSQYKKIPSLEELGKIDESLLGEKGCVFVTLYKKGEICGAAGNIKEIAPNLAEELIANALAALGDSRFEDIDVNEIKSIKIRIDVIDQRSIITPEEMKQIDPVKQGILILKKDYSNMACILPNINAKILSGEDFLPLLANKLGEKKLDPNTCILYQISTKQETNF